MGYPRHDAVIATVNGYVFKDGTTDVPAPDIDAFRASLPEEWRHLVIGPIASLVNDYVTFAFLPDGSKEGWGTSDDGDTHRQRFVEMFSACHGDGSSPFDVVVVAARYGGDEPGAGYEPELVVTSNIQKVSADGRVWPDRELAAAEAGYEWGTRTSAGRVAEAGRNEELARRRLAEYPEYTGLVRRQAWYGEWEDVAYADNPDPVAAAVESMRIIERADRGESGGETP